mgnify:CR=1 FL=1
MTFLSYVTDTLTCSINSSVDLEHLSSYYQVHFHVNNWSNSVPLSIVQCEENAPIVRCVTAYHACNKSPAEIVYRGFFFFFKLDHQHVK